MEIICEFDMCIYNKNNNCILICAKIDSCGNCENAIIPSIPLPILKKYKDDLLKLYNHILENKK